MKTASAIYKLLAIITAFALLTGSSSAGVIDLMRGEPVPKFQRVAFVGSAVVKQVNGTAERLVGIDRWQPLKDGVTLPPGELVRTRQGTVILRMKESQSFVRVTPHTILRLAEVEQRWDRSILSGREEKQGFIVRSCRGQAFSRPAQGDWSAIKVNTVLASGSEVRTEAGSVVDLYNTETRRPLRIPGSSEVLLNEATFVNQVLVQPKLVTSAGK